jgi:hypothetical protein
VPALDSSNVFGIAVKMSTSELPREAQRNTYPGLNGVEELDQGHRGRITKCTGMLVGTSPGGLAGAENGLRSFKDGLTHVLTDSNGTGTWILAQVHGSFKASLQHRNSFIPAVNLRDLTG